MGDGMSPGVTSSMSSTSDISVADNDRSHTTCRPTYSNLEETMTRNSSLNQLSSVCVYYVIKLTSRVPVEGKSSLCVICMKFMIII